MFYVLPFSSIRKVIERVFSKQDIWKWKNNRVAQILYNGMLLQEMSSSLK